jgi:hypothetical protein
MIDDRLDEAPLGVFSTALIILTHKEIVLDSGCLNVCCAGDERSPMGKESSFYQVPLFGVSTLSREDLKERSQLLSLGQSVPSSYGKKNLILSSRDKQYPPGKGDSFATLFLP